MSAPVRERRQDRAKSFAFGQTPVIQTPELGSRIMRYELADYAWTAIKPMLPNKPRGPTSRRKATAAIRSASAPISTALATERFKQCCRVATRYDRLVANYLAFVQLASIRLWLRLYESAP
jgi:transposase